MNAPILLLISLAATAHGSPSEFFRTSGINWPFKKAHAKMATETPSPTEEQEQAELATPATPVEPRIRVILDAGHGGHDHGAQIAGLVREKEVCLRIAKLAQSRLERLANVHDVPLDVSLTRGADHFVPLRDRAARANEWGADFFVSIHANSSPVVKARGFEVYFLSNEATDADASRVARKENQEAAQPMSAGILSILSDLQTNAHILESSRFAEVVHSSLSQRVRPNGKGVRQAPFTVLAGTQMPALLVEVGYLTHPEEARALLKTSYQDKLAIGIAEGILNAARRLRRPAKELPSFAPRLSSF